ncbi:hypothetical protein EYC84_010964 [Monilinia fructicola]|uniref:Uncharacterized protein n=1 Tax=Monilinia fructicola TaxID=38448 RepID=A0A5M9J6V0_MONFR|nr:hypothetical protein EYC84_010964 [Monilinia fructicola]
MIPWKAVSSNLFLLIDTSANLPREREKEKKTKTKKKEKKNVDSDNKTNLAGVCLVLSTMHATLACPVGARALGLMD